MIVAQYRTEVVIAADRYVCLQLPANLPTGRAIVTVMVLPAEEAQEPEPAPDVEPDHQDIEWWEEFEEDRERVG
jgi:hypothetical protein